MVWKTSPDDTKSITVMYTPVAVAKPTAYIDDLTAYPTRPEAGARCVMHCLIMSRGPGSGNFAVRFTVNGVTKDYTTSLASGAEKDMVHAFTMPAKNVAVKAEVYSEA